MGPHPPPPPTPWGRGEGGGSKILVTVGQNQLFLENKVVINFDFRYGAKKQVIWTTSCKVMAKYISIYFDIFYEKLVYSGCPA